ncbi:hypothetical protein HNP37_000150 [Flavobacterium nitrogenifigens]|uniref:Uncharacterized protein n=2 Tax=Flavobacterium TaxID=237 RepID=A0A7W7IT89_9FLAO|nr:MULTISPECIES: hypothetical protein [Flavobacterium]MBB4800111.1 hypothetical protein [Flavobacterium nitrogenifigens]MBB6386139.1 hypothetical protein [Flavobacterium notoginsengisoli]
MRNLNNVPKVIMESKSIGHPIDFKWTKKKIDQLLDPIERNEDLENLLMQINHKGSIGLTAALLEWVYWRFTGYSQATNDTQKRIEALWCSINNLEQTNPLLFDTDFEIPATGSVNGALWIALMNVRMIDVRYRKGSYFLQNELVGLVLLARHITPRTKKFDNWFSRIMSELIHTHPNPYKNAKLDESDEAVYDSTNEPSISREYFFDETFNYTVEASENALHSFIDNLDHKANAFLNFSKKAS